MIIHRAGVMRDAVQLCEWCGTVLTDYRGAMILEQDPPLRGWAVGALVGVDGPMSLALEPSRAAQLEHGEPVFCRQPGGWSRG